MLKDPLSQRTIERPAWPDKPTGSGSLQPLLHRRLEPCGDGRKRRSKAGEVIPEENEHSGRRRRRHGRGAPSRTEQRHLTEEVPSAEYRDLIALRRNRDLAVADNEKGVASRSFPHESHTRFDLPHLKPRGDLGKL